jgi:hypothetical protein
VAGLVLGLLIGGFSVAAVERHRQVGFGPGDGRGRYQQGPMRHGFRPGPGIRKPGAPGAPTAPLPAKPSPSPS